MELKVNRETVFSAECVHDGNYEHSLELDYILPDYYPDVFKLVKSEVIPVITDYTINGTRLTYELRCDIRVLYCSESGNVLQCVTQKQTHSKTLELDNLSENPVVEIRSKCDHINCRAINQRRLDLRGAVSVKVKVIGEKSQQVVSDAFGDNVRLKKIPLSFSAQKITGKKLVQLSEDIELSSVMPSILSVARSECKAVTCETKAVSGKILAKGEATVHFLYSCEKDGEGALEPMEFTLAYSQMIDADGESGGFSVKPEVIYCDVIPVQGKDGESRSVKCELEIQLVSSCVKSETIELGLDAYSTTYPCTTAYTGVKAEQVTVSRAYEIQNDIKFADSDGLPLKVYYMWCTPKNVSARILKDEKKISVSGMLTYSMAVRDASGMIAMPAKDEAFEEIFDLEENLIQSDCAIELAVKEVTYSISPETGLTATAVLSAEVQLTSAVTVNVLTEIEVDTTTKKQRDGDYAIKLYYGQENEDLWEIAKRYSTCVSAISEENDISGETLENSGMLIIPIIN